MPEDVASHHKDVFNKMALLTTAKIIGILFTLVIPMYLGRELSVETYATYKQIMLFYWFAQVALNLGLDDSAYFFLRTNHKNFPLYCFNAMLFNLLATGLLWFVLCVGSQGISHVLKNPELAQYLPLLGYLTLATVSSMQIEGILIAGLDRFKERLYLEVGIELLKSLAIFCGFYFFNSLHIVLVFLSALMTVRLLTTISIIHNCKNKLKLSYREASKYFLPQLKYGLPLGISRVLQNMLNIENYFISSFFSLAQFTYYSVGCFENPLINAARTSMYILVNIDMADSIKHNDHRLAVEIWRRMSRKLFLITIPFVTYMIFFAHELIVFLFSHKYLPSVPFFMVFNIFLVVGALNPEPLFKATANTRLNLQIKVIGFIVGIALLVGGAYWGGAMGALIGKILGVLIMNAAGLILGARLLKTNFWNLFQWKQLGGVFLLSLALSATLRQFFWQGIMSPFFTLAASFSLYFLLHFLLSCWTRLIKDDEIHHLKTIVIRLLAKFKIRVIPELASEALPLERK